MRKLLAVALLALLAISYATEYEIEDDVLVLGQDTFDQALAEFSHILVEFYAPWCGHCKKLAPEYAKAAQSLKAEGSTIKLAKVDSTVHPTVSGRYEVKGYPTLKFFVHGNPIPFEGGRTEGEIVNWVKRKVQPSSVQIDSVEEFETTLKSHDVVVVFWGDSSSPHWSVFETVSRVFDDVHFVSTTHEELKKKHNADSDDVVTLFKNFDEGVVDYEGDFTSDLVTNFIKEHQFPTIMGFDQKIAQKIFSEQTPALFLMVQSDEASEKAHNAFKAVAPKLKGKWYISVSNIDEGLGGRLSEFVGIKREELPAVRLLHPTPGGNPRKFRFTEDITPENLYAFYESFTAGNLKPYMKSEPRVVEQTEAVFTVVGESFDEIVMDEETDVLVEFYAPWCGHCKALAPEFEKAALELAAVKGLKIAKVDSTANEIEGVNIQGYPTLKFYPAHHKGSPVDYDGERNADGIVKWLKEHATHAEWPTTEEAVPAGEL
jgi:protein disulfide-isomerase A1